MNRARRSRAESDDVKWDSSEQAVGEPWYLGEAEQYGEGGENTVHEWRPPSVLKGGCAEEFVRLWGNWRGDSVDT